jgi:hypothetical protein
MKKPKVVKINRGEVKQVINSIPFSAFFSTTFIKQNGAVRKMNCNRLISKGLKNQRQPFTVEKSLLNVYDVNVKNEDGTKGGYRYVNLDTVSEIRANKKIYQVI